MKLQIDEPLLNSLLVLATVIEARDAYTGGHTWRVSQYARVLAHKLGLGPGEIFVAKLGGLVHDLGKVGIPDSILNKKDKLNDTEYIIMKEHPVIGENVIISHPLSPLVKAAITEHHERIDGKGYPHKTEKSNLSVIGKIISIADAFDAMTSTRPYRRGMPPEKAYSIIEEELGNQFDNETGRSFIELGRSGSLSHVLGHSSDESMMLMCPGCGPIITHSQKAKEGDNLMCPACTGEFVAHKKGETFELEFKETMTSVYVPQPDLETVEGIIREAPKEIDL
ncbi:MAG: HD-GYP domain-containing protein [bacterium]|nr:HD-GYP domain-containing protein [bacterium]